MKRNIIQIDREKCDGCGICIDACHEQALVLIDGKAVLISDSYCDGLGDCLPECPQDAIQVVQRDAAPYDDDAVKTRIAQMKSGGCPSLSATLKQPAPVHESTGNTPSQLQNWPLQIQLAPVQSPYYEEAHILIAADCVPFAYGDFHTEMLAGRVCLIGCPKLDSVDYSEKLGEIFENNNIASVTVVRMEVPCCGGIVAGVERALENTNKQIPWSIRTVSLNGEIL